jgi:hypothetical protein
MFIAGLLADREIGTQIVKRTPTGFKITGFPKFGAGVSEGSEPIPFDG